MSGVDRNQPADPQPGDFDADEIAKMDRFAAEQDAELSAGRRPSVADQMGPISDEPDIGPAMRVRPSQLKGGALRATDPDWLLCEQENDRLRAERDQLRTELAEAAKYRQHSIEFNSLTWAIATELGFTEGQESIPLDTDRLIAAVHRLRSIEQQTERACLHGNGDEHYPHDTECELASWAEAGLLRAQVQAVTKIRDRMERSAFYDAMLRKGDVLDELSAALIPTNPEPETKP